MPDESIKKMILVALGVCLVCSLLVSTTAVSLRSVQEENKRLDRITNILAAADLSFTDQDMQKMYENNIHPLMVQLETGRIIPKDSLDEILNMEAFDIKSMAGSTEYGKAVPAEEDMAKIGKMPRYMVVYQVMNNNKMEKIILPVYGMGLWSTMYGFVALDRDLKTIMGITFYEHAETPGLGGEIDNPRWKSIWKGKQAFDNDGKLKIRVVKGPVDQSGSEAKYQVDGISGATITSTGVNNTIVFWLGSNGYAPFLKRLMEELHG